MEERKDQVGVLDSVMSVSMGYGFQDFFPLLVVSAVVENFW
jgi:hypothetical protein